MTIGCPSFRSYFEHSVLLLYVANIYRAVCIIAMYLLVLAPHKTSFSSLLLLPNLRWSIMLISYVLNTWILQTKWIWLWNKTPCWRRVHAIEWPGMILWGPTHYPRLPVMQPSAFQPIFPAYPQPSNGPLSTETCLSQVLQQLIHETKMTPSWELMRVLTMFRFWWQAAYTSWGVFWSLSIQTLMMHSDIATQYWHCWT